MVGIKVNAKPWSKKTWEDVVSIDVTYRDKERSWPLVHIWRRTKSGKTKVEDKDSFPSYFYIPKSEESTLKSSNVNPDSIEYPNIRSIDGQELIKLNYQKFNYEQLKTLREVFNITYEDDVKYKLRYMIDNDIKFAVDRRICFFDIENNMSLDTINTPEKILSIAAYDNFSKNSFCFVLDPIVNARVVKEQRSENVFVLRYKDETSMLNDFISYIKSHNFDIITAYNLNAFDWPYLINRMKKLGVSYRDMSDTGNCYVFIDEEDQTMNRVYCGGRELIDYYILIKKYYDEDKPEDYKLDTVAEKILGIKKIDYPYDHVGELYKEDIELFIDYNLQDVVIIKELDEKVKFISAYLVSLQQLIPMPLQPIIDNSVALDFYILKTYNGKVVFPSKRKKERVAFPGAITGKLVINKKGEIVSEPPEKKMFSNIAVFDFSALYPNIFKTFNISPETITIPGDPDSITIGDVAFMQGKQGLLPGLVDGIIKLRKKYQDELETMSPNNPNYVIYHNIQYAIKRVNNSLYGACSYPGFRLFDIRVARAITELGQKMIKESFKYTSLELKYNVIYSDTDSIFVELKCDMDDKEATVKEIESLELEINKHIEEIVLGMGSQENFLVMDAEKRFRKLIFLGVKKIYLGTSDFWKGKFLEKNKYLIKGFALVRREMPNPIKDLIRKIIYGFLDGNNSDDIKKVYHEGVKNLKGMTPHQLAWTKGINKNITEYTKTTPQHIKAAMLAKKELGIDFLKGDYPKMMYINPPIKISHIYTNKILSCDCIAFKRDTVLPEKIMKMIDYDRLLSSFVHNKLEMFFGVEGIEMEKVVQTGTTLLSFFEGGNISRNMIDDVNKTIEEGI
jgi:DNA polymerase elongation subunit (family B)